MTKSSWVRTQGALAGAMLLFSLTHGVHAQAPAQKTLTMQASWPASSMFMDNFN